MTIEQRLSSNGLKIYYRFVWGHSAKNKLSSGLFTWAKPKSQTEKNHNKEVLAILEVKRSQLILDQQAVGSGYIPAHRYKHNFLDFFEEFVQNNSRSGKRHLQNSFTHFKAFLNNVKLSPIDVTEELCVRYRNYLLAHFNGDTPMNYFSEFKRMIRAATKQGYFRINPVTDVKAKSGKRRRLKDHLEVREYLQLLKTPCPNRDVRDAFILCCYTGLRWADVKPLSWSDIGNNTLRTRIIQAKTGEAVTLTMHEIASAILDQRSLRFKGSIPSGRIFNLPSADGATKILDVWMKDAGIKKHITWHCARLSFSILLQDEQVDGPTVALLLGHRSTKHVNEVYKRHRPRDQSAVIAKLPRPTDVKFV